jgi:hypothetical protein
VTSDEQGKIIFLPKQPAKAVALVPRWNVARSGTQVPAEVPKAEAKKSTRSGEQSLAESRRYVEDPENRLTWRLEERAIVSKIRLPPNVLNHSGASAEKVSRIANRVCRHDDDISRMANGMIAVESLCKLCRIPCAEALWNCLVPRPYKGRAGTCRFIALVSAGGRIHSIGSLQGYSVKVLDLASIPGRTRFDADSSWTC